MDVKTAGRYLSSRMIEHFFVRHPGQIGRSGNLRQESSHGFEGESPRLQPAEPVPGGKRIAQAFDQMRIGAVFLSAKPPRRNRFRGNDSRRRRMNVKAAIGEPVGNLLQYLVVGRTE
jgi:hypothetical protein